MTLWEDAWCFRSTVLINDGLGCSNSACARRVRKKCPCIAALAQHSGLLILQQQYTDLTGTDGILYKHNELNHMLPSQE